MPDPEMAEVHQTAVVDPEAQLAEDCSVGPYCVVGPNVRLESGVQLVAHVVVEGHTTIGENTIVYPFACIGLRPQDMKYKGEESELVIGDNNTIREHVTMNPGTAGGGLVTRVGNRCLFMVGSHVAHDCHVGDEVVMANNATLGGHVELGDYSMLGGLAAVHQFCRVGRYAMVGGMSGVENDVIPFGSVTGNRARLAGLNVVGLKRRRFSRDDIHSLRAAYRLLFAEEGTLAERLEDVAELFSDNPGVMEIVRFIRADSQRAICTPASGDVV